MAPEVLHGDSYDEKCDLFSLGCVFYFLMTGLGLFEGLSPKEIAARTKDSNFIFHKVSKISSLNSPAEDLLKKLLSVDPCTRISALDSLSHPYF